MGQAARPVYRSLFGRRPLLRRGQGRQDFHLLDLKRLPYSDPFDRRHGHRHVRFLRAHQTAAREWTSINHTLTCPRRLNGAHLLAERYFVHGRNGILPGVLFSPRSSRRDAAHAGAAFRRLDALGIQRRRSLLFPGFSVRPWRSRPTQRSPPVTAVPRRRGGPRAAPSDLAERGLKQRRGPS